MPHTTHFDVRCSLPLGNPFRRQCFEEGAAVSFASEIFDTFEMLSVLRLFVQVPDGRFFMSCSFVSMQNNSIEGPLPPDTFAGYDALEQ